MLLAVINENGHSGLVTILKGTELAQQIRAGVKSSIDALVATGRTAPTVAVVMAAETPEALVYVESVERSFSRVGICSRRVSVPDGATDADLQELIRDLAEDTEVHGILVPTPLRPGLTLLAAQDALPPAKDVEGISSANVGRLALGRPLAIPATPLGGMELLRHYGVELSGKHATVVGRSSVVGWPMATLLTQANATVTVCHSRTPNLAEHTRRADIVVAAAGRPAMITAAMVRSGAVVVDFGVNVTEQGMCGDVDYNSVSAVASAITPVPGGTGPVTAAVLVRNVYEAATRVLNMGAQSK